MKYIGTKAPQQSSDFPDAFYRVTVKGLYVKDGKALMTKDLTNRGVAWEWELPGGGLDFGEDIHEGLKREIKEEMGLAVTKVSEKPLYLWPIKHESARGMEWYWVLVVIFGIEFENLDFIPTEECKEIRFMSKAELEAELPQIADQIRPLSKYFNPSDFS